jgi:hypothetical protein
MGSLQRVPTGDHAVSWYRSTGSYNYANVDEYPNTDDTDYNWRNSSDEEDQFSFTPFNVPAGAVITNIKVYLRGKTSATNDNYMGALVVAGGFKLIIGDVPWTTSFTEKAYTWTTNPKTELPWTIDDVNGVGANALQYFGYCGSAMPEITRTASRVYIEVNYTGGSKSRSFII